jgi:hypothetical protein
MMLPMTQCKRRLAALWFGGAGILFVILLIKTLGGRYGDRVDEAWEWWLPTIMPTLSLIVGVLVMDAAGKTVRGQTVAPFLYRLTLGLSVVYLLAVAAPMLARPVLREMSVYTLMGLSHLWLSPFQGLVCACLGAFFVRKGTS